MKLVWRGRDLANPNVAQEGRSTRFQRCETSLLSQGSDIRICTWRNWSFRPLTHHTRIRRLHVIGELRLSLILIGMTRRAITILGNLKIEAKDKIEMKFRLRQFRKCYIKFAKIVLPYLLLYWRSAYLDKSPRNVILFLLRPAIHTYRWIRENFDEILKVYTVVFCVTFFPFRASFVAFRIFRAWGEKTFAKCETLVH